MKPRTAFLRLWGWPIALGILTTIGLVAGLLSDGWGDVVAWTGLGVPAAAGLWFGWLAPRR